MRWNSRPLPFFGEEKKRREERGARCPRRRRHVARSPGWPLTKLGALGLGHVGSFCRAEWSPLLLPPRREVARSDLKEACCCCRGPKGEEPSWANRARPAALPDVAILADTKSRLLHEAPFQARQVDSDRQEYGFQNGPAVHFVNCLGDQGRVGNVASLCHGWKTLKSLGTWLEDASGESLL